MNIIQLQQRLKELKEKYNESESRSEQASLDAQIFETEQRIRTQEIEKLRTQIREETDKKTKKLLEEKLTEKDTGKRESMYSRTAEKTESISNRKAVVSELAQAKSSVKDDKVLVKIKLMPTVTISQKQAKIEAFESKIATLESQKIVLGNSLMVAFRETRINAIDKVIKNIRGYIDVLQGKINKAEEKSLNRRDKIARLTGAKLSKVSEPDEVESISNQQLREIAEKEKKEQEEQRKLIQQSVQLEVGKAVRIEEALLDVGANQENISEFFEGEPASPKSVKELVETNQEIAETLKQIEENQIDEQKTAVKAPLVVSKELERVPLEQVPKPEKKKPGILGTLLGALGMFFGKDIFSWLGEIGRVGPVKYLTGLITSTVKSLFGTIANGIKAGVSKAVGFITNVFSKFKETMMKKIEPIVKFIDDIKGTIGKAVDTVKTFTTNIYESAKKVIAGDTKKVSAELGEKAVGKTVKKGVGKSLVKKIPGLGLLAGVAFAIDRAVDGDVIGAGLEVVSGALSLIPGIGTAGSTAVDAYLIKREIDRPETIEPISTKLVEPMEETTKENAQKPETDKNRKELTTIETSKNIIQEFQRFAQGPIQSMQDQLMANAPIQPAVAMNINKDKDEFVDINKLYSDNILNG